MLGEFKPGDTTYYLLGLDVIGQQQNGTWSYFGYDGLGSVRQMTDAAGVVQYGVNFDPYGQIFEQFGPVRPNLGFTGEYTDLSGLLYLRARYANVDIGTFLTRDPFEGVMQRVMSRNGYSYAEGNPINYTDPSGKFPGLAAVVAFVAACPACALAVAAAVVAAVGIGWVWYQAFNNPGVKQACQELEESLKRLLSQAESFPQVTVSPDVWTSPGTPFPVGTPIGSPSTPFPITTPVPIPIPTAPVPGSNIVYTIPKPTVSNPTLQKIIGIDYPQSAQVGNGSTADAILHEHATGQKVGNRNHLKEGIDLRRAYARWIYRQQNTYDPSKKASQSDIKIAKKLHNQLSHALQIADPTGTYPIIK